MMLCARLGVTDGRNELVKGNKETQSKAYKTPHINVYLERGSI